MTFPKPDESYWNNKLAAYLHDPIDKIFRIKGHEERAAKQLEALGLQKPNEAFWKKADGIAAGFERGQVPSYSSDPNQNGAIDFSENPIITHPTAKSALLEILLPESGSTEFANKVGDELLAFLKTNIGMKPDSGGYSDNDIFKNNPKKFAFARFLYVHHGLRFKFAENDVAGLGGLWHRLPADSRFPDHTIWQHNALTSALYSCMDLAKDASQVGVLSFSITPVQSFIATARKLRDYWTGSVLLSWLAFEGLRWIIEHLGSDHLLYPSLIDQPLVNEYLQATWKMGEITSLSESRDIASLPNKFLCLVPFDQAEIIATDIKEHIQTSWRAVCQQVLQKIIRIAGESSTHLSEIFQRQTDNFWNLQWAAVKLIEKRDIEEAKNLLPINDKDESVINEPEKVFKSFADLVREKWKYEMDARGLLYTRTHQLAQTALAVCKTRKKINRPEEPGQKCRLCAEFEVLHSVPYSGDSTANEYKKHIDDFWTNLSEGWGAEADLDGREKLCALCLIKRIAYRILKEDKEHILHACFGDAESFPSTTEMALHQEFKRRKISDKKQKRQIAQQIHDKEENEVVDNLSRYYAILVMDGDHMGKLINGETIGATWGSAMHPVMRDRLQEKTFDASYRIAWEPLLKENRKRLITPAIHAAISESLGDFSIYGVSDIIKRHEGRLIYAGGDDVCAVMPVNTVVKAAREISRYYNAEFKLVTDDATVDVDSRRKWEPVPGKLSVNLGRNVEKNEDLISISAGILICHHKEGLNQMIARAHALLKNRAKETAGRNACAVELRKRSGGSRYFVRKWNDNVAWEAFEQLGQWIKVKNKQKVSTSLIYRLERFRDGVEAMIQEENHKELLLKFIAKQLERSGIKTPKGKESDLAAGITEIVLEHDESGNPTFRPEGLIVAAFIADTESEVQ
ncbi:MAG TPA: type III-B CRISPR-associated protein Cas10/Cmr2 [Desulfobacterales bacterium]|nr:type III-B CRISPR-associated protein Cas10/Cmr2 [Desulfobacterales bacterium]